MPVLLSVAALMVLLVAHWVFGDTVARAGGIAGLCFWCALCPLDDRRIKIFLCSLLMFIMSIAIIFVLGWINYASPFKYDVYLHAIDHTLGICPPQILFRIIQQHSLWRTVLGAYQLLPTMMVAGYGWALYSNSLPNRLLASYFITALCAALYLIVPACGPSFLLGNSFASAHVSASVSLIRLGYVANCIPSAHLSMAITIWFFNRTNAITRTACLIFIFLTGFSTLALGEHYLIDLVLSFPFAVFVVSSATAQYCRAGVSMLCVLLWLTSIRLSIHTLLDHSLWLWSAAALTVAVSCVYLKMDPAQEAQEVRLNEAVAA